MVAVESRSCLDGGRRECLTHVRGLGEFGADGFVRCGGDVFVLQGRALGLYPSDGRLFHQFPPPCRSDFWPRRAFQVSLITATAPGCPAAATAAVFRPGRSFVPRLHLFGAWIDDRSDGSRSALMPDLLLADIGPCDHAVIALRDKTRSF